MRHCTRFGAHSFRAGPHGILVRAGRRERRVKPMFAFGRSSRLFGPYVPTMPAASVDCRCVRINRRVDGQSAEVADANVGELTGAKRPSTMPYSRLYRWIPTSVPVPASMRRCRSRKHCSTRQRDHASAQGEHRTSSLKVRCGNDAVRAIGLQGRSALAFRPDLRRSRTSP